MASASVWRPNKGTLEHLLIPRTSLKALIPLSQVAMHPLLSVSSLASRWGGLWVQGQEQGNAYSLACSMLLCRAVTSPHSTLWGEGGNSWSGDE